MSIILKEKQSDSLFSVNKNNYDVLTKNKYTVLELFAGAGGLALGFEQAGFNHILLNEIDKRCCETLKINRPEWPILQGDISNINFSNFYKKVDVVAGGFPCQAFSVAGKKRGFDDKRGQLFFQYARAIREIQPIIFVAENVKGLLYHEKGKTLTTMINTLKDCGYQILKPTVMRAVNYQVPQKRERIFIIGIRKDISNDFQFPEPSNKIYTLKDALKKGELYSSDVPISTGEYYSESKFAVLSQVSAGGNWKQLPFKVQLEYLKNAFGKGSNAQVARRLSWDEPCMTLLTKPQSKRVERCHPDETRPLTIREYARIQTFPDDWEFAGAIYSQYQQIGNAVPVHLAKAIAQSVSNFLSNTFSSNSLGFQIN